jgi:hypothetical protein
VLSPGGATSADTWPLKRQYGGSIVVYQNGVVATDTKTGEVARTKTATRIHRAIVLPVTLSREVKQSISLISANKQMVTGGGFESGKRLFIIERRDCPSLVLHKSDWLAYNGRKYAIENHEEYEFDVAYIITGKELPGESLGVAGSIVDPSADSALALDSQAVAET